MGTDSAMIEDVDAGTFESFTQAFSDRTGACCGDCECGKTFYNPDESWTWGEGEIDKLAANKNAVSLPYAVGYVCFEGRRYVTDCKCWQKRARQVIAFLREHDEEIAEFLRKEKKRKQDEADRSPTI